MFFTEGKTDTISLYEIKFGLEKINIKVKNQDLFSLMKRYDLDRSGVLNYNEFKRMITPKERLSDEKVLEQTDIKFSKETLILFNNLMIEIIEGEMAIEALRSSSNKSQEGNFVSLSEAFADSAQGKPKFLTATEVNFIIIIDKKFNDYGKVFNFK